MGGFRFGYGQGNVNENFAQEEERPAWRDSNKVCFRSHPRPLREANSTQHRGRIGEHAKPVGAHFISQPLLGSANEPSTPL